MQLLKKKYASLAPHADYLCDVVVLAQAWKKSHTYIRRYNWYADTLELDCSATDLEPKLDKWSKELAAGHYRPEASRLVLAPKNAAWAFAPSIVGGWGPIPSEPLVLRPLAHIGIREQTIATALLLCLADCIESAQGNPAQPAERAAANGVHSYGNRLYCNWTDSERRARFSWGNSNTYSRYFQDYQQFVERPNAIAQRLDKDKKADELIYIIKLDLTAFYDNIDIERLVSCLEDEYAAFQRSFPTLPAAEPQFWHLARSALSFSWSTEDVALASLLRGGVLPTGLPQGLVASGFLANAYLLAFDRAVGSAVKSRLPTEASIFITLHDYCRYVDDLRLVVTVQTDDVHDADIATAVLAWAQEQLDKSTNAAPGVRTRLQVGSDKVEVELYSSVGGQSGAGARMKSLQQQLSGPFDMAVLEQVETGLNGLLALAELGLKEEATSSALDRSLPALASVARTKLEVRDDTLTRFSAYRITKSLRLRRSMTDLTEVVEGGTAQDALLHDFEVTARRLIAMWAVNPSLVQVLRYALDLFPAPELLAPIRDALTSKLVDEAAAPYDQRVVFYVLAELFRAGATETGYRWTQEPAFAVGNVAAYREELGILAQTVLELPKLPWYVQQQAALLLASLHQSTQSLSSDPALRFHRVLHEYIRSESKARLVAASDEMAVSLVGHQLLGNRTHYLTWFRRFAFGRERTVVKKGLELVARTSTELFEALTSPGTASAGARGAIPRYLREYVNAGHWPPEPPELPANKWMPLAQAITHPSVPFGQENPLLELAFALANLPSSDTAEPQRLTPLTIAVRCNDWKTLAVPRTSRLEAKYIASRYLEDPAYSTPAWCASNCGWMYAFGRLLRAAATGELDFTTRHWLLREQVGWYRGIRSSWQKRQIGMLHTATAIGGTTSALTPWFSQLLLVLLQWPGIAGEDKLYDDFASLTDQTSFISLVRDRLAEQARIFGTSSNLPIYCYPVQWPLRPNRHLRVALVQGLMPATLDFKSGLSALDSLSFRARHRNHTAAVLQLAYRKLSARDSVLGKEHKPQVDLVIFPEYAIHVSDQDLMRAFSDATDAMLFYGLVGAMVPGTKDHMNAARWLVPQRRAGRRSWVEVDQGKWHLTEDEKLLKVKSWRPYQVVIELRWNTEPGYRIAGAVCYDATDLALAADLKDVTHMFVVAAMNKDVKTFDSMVGALRYHMYQHVLVANSGEFGGSTAQAPYDKEHRRLLAHVHGAQQIAVSLFDVPIDDFGPGLAAAKVGKATDGKLLERIGKTPPAGLNRM